MTEVTVKNQHDGKISIHRDSTYHGLHLTEEEVRQVIAELGELLPDVRQVFFTKEEVTWLHAGVLRYADVIVPQQLEIRLSKLLARWPEAELPPLKAIVEVVKAADSTNEHVGAYGHVVGYDRTSQCGQTPGDPLIIVSFSGGGQGRFWKEELVELVRKESK